MHLILFGPYGCGKGTQARIFSEKYVLPIFSTGDELRRHMKEETEIGKKVAAIVASGGLAPDEIIMEITKEFIEKNTKGFIFDGLPRTLVQAEAIDTLLKHYEIIPTRIWIDIPESLSLERQIGRKTCPKCRAIFPASYTSDVCGECQTPFENRFENDKTVAQKRLEVFKQEILPVLEMYEEKKLLTKIDGMMKVEEVTGHIENLIKKNDSN